jgi:Ca2+-binding RTX toxin-like protein
MQGGTGNDLYFVHTPGDTIAEFTGEGTDTVETDLSSYTLPANVENLIYSGTGSFTGTGNNLDNFIQGGAGNDVLSGGNGGNDYLVGGAGDDTLIDGGPGSASTLQGGIGNDTYVVQSTNDSIVEFAGEGTDTVQTALSSYILPANVENLTFLGSGLHTGVGNALNNTFTGTPGEDIFTGGGGNDVFNFRASTNGADTIMDFNADNNNAAEHDHIDLQGRGLTFTSLSITSVSDGVVVGIPGGDTIHLKGVAASSLDAGDFFF